ncbi:pseudouridine synthase [Panacibacter microcysteis]|nr:pseudouridine synthase [Panacibacter microcysteis]
MAKHAFDKFMNKESGAKKKEAIRQEKRKIKKEIRKKIEESKLQKAAATNGFLKKRLEAEKTAKNNDKPNSTTPQRPVNRPSNTTAPRYKQGKPVKQTYQQITQKPQQQKESEAEQMPLNKYIAHAGICGRREAADLVKEGKVKVNGSIVYEPGYKVGAADKVVFKGKQLYAQKNPVYILLNKPKDYITTAKDPEGRKTVLDLLKGATDERIYPVGRLDRNTTGVLVLTNDGELAQKLTHPSFEIKKIYEVRLDKPVAKKDLEAILAGVTLEDGFINADAVSYADAKDKSVIGIEIHSGRNRIVRRIFEHLGYDVKNLDRVMFANLTKKNVDRGKWRFLTEKEVRLLKYMNKSFVRNKKEE